MPKQTKRQRKFQASGGVQGRIDKGATFGKPKRRKTGKRDETPPSKNNPTSKQGVAKRSDGILSPENIGDLDVDSFFAAFAPGGAAEIHTMDSAEQQQQMNQEDAVSEDEVSFDNEDEDEEQNATEDTKDLDQKEEDSNDGDDESSDDEDPEVAEARMKAEMEKLQQSDPEFHKYLKDNEASLLDFQAEINDAKGETPQEEAEAEETQEPKGGIQLTAPLLSKLCTGAFERHSIKYLRKLVAAYRCACHLSEAKSQNNPDFNFVIDSSKVFNDLMVFCLNKCHVEFRHHLNIDQIDDKDALNKPISPKSMEKSDRWEDLRPILLSFFRSTQHVLTEAKDSQLLAFVLKSFVNFCQLLTPFPPIAESMLKTLTELWSAPLGSSEDYHVVRLYAFLRIRQLALTQPFPFLEDCLKKTYLSYAKRAKFGGSASNSEALSTLTFMGNCVVELYSLDFQCSYQHAFVYIRQLALHLRTAYQKKTVESFQQVYCLQYIQCLRLWTAVLAAAAPAEDGELMKSLVYPLVEIIMATARSCPSPVRHAPLRFHCVRFLQQLAASAEIFVPTTPLLLDCLEWKEWTSNPKKSKKEVAHGVDISTIVKFGKEDPLRSYEQLEACMTELVLLLNREIDLYRYSAGFPEYSIRITVRLRQFAKTLKNGRWKAFCRACVETAEKHSTFAIAERSKLKEAPKDVKVLECLRPTDQKNMLERYEDGVSKERTSIAGATEQAQPKRSNEDTNAEPTIGKKKRKKLAKKRNKSSFGAISGKTLDEDELKVTEDEVHEGIDWSDEE